MNLKETGKFISDRRKELELTQEQLALSMNVTAKAVSKWERGLSFPDISLFGALAVALKCSVSDLINGSFSNDKSSNIKLKNFSFDTSVVDLSENPVIRFDFDSRRYVSPFLFGNNLEHTRNCIHQGLSAQMLENRKFVGKPGPKGCAYGWTAVGKNLFLAFSKPYTRHAEDYHMRRILECNSLQIAAMKSHEICGIRQGGLHIERNKKYDFSIAVKSVYDCSLNISLCRNDGSLLCNETIPITPHDDFTEKETVLMPTESCENAALSITFDGLNTIFIGAVSLMPLDNFHGMRKDVIARMKEMGISVLRWPGGNFAGEYNWKDGLMSPNMRAPFQSFRTIETQPHSMGYDFHEINTDDFITLCREIGAEPFITINPTWNTPEETAQWVEYCNGDETTEYGKIRISRGHKEPYNVRFWSLGNEFGYGHMEGANNPYEYSKAVRQHAAAMLDAAPYLSLCSAGPYPDVDWVNHSAKHLSDVAEYVSLHYYVRNFPAFADPALYKEEYEAFIKNAFAIRELARCQRKYLGNDKLRISFDEWNSWYAWYRPESVCDGIFAALVLHILIKDAEALGIDIACHFEAINEGAIVTEPGSARLTPMGKAFAVMKHHKFGKLLFAGDNAVTTENEGKITTTLINSLYDEEKEYRIPVIKENVCATLFRSDDVRPNSTFSEEEISFTQENGEYVVKMPPHSIALFIQQ